jgi:hypothetical protein
VFAIVQLIRSREFLEDFLRLIVRRGFIGCGCGYRLRFASAAGADLENRSSLTDGKPICFVGRDNFGMANPGRRPCLVCCCLPPAAGRLF